jgi:hypothetical protein
MTESREAGVRKRKGRAEVSRREWLGAAAGTQPRLIRIGVGGIMR